jgi:hypothetical protein
MMLAQLQNSPRSGVVQDFRIVTFRQFYELIKNSAAIMFGLLPYVDRAAGQVPVIHESVAHYLRPPRAPDQPPLPEFDPLDEVPMSPEINRAREHPGIPTQTIQ